MGEEGSGGAISVVLTGLGSVRGSPTNCDGMVPLNLFENKYMVFSDLSRSKDFERVPVS